MRIHFYFMKAHESRFDRRIELNMNNHTPLMDPSDKVIDSDEVSRQDDKFYVHGFIDRGREMVLSKT